MSIRRVSAVAVASFVLASAYISGQSLGDVARKEETRRKEVKSSGKVYTNDDLRPSPGPAPAAPDSATQANGTPNTGGDASSQPAAPGSPTAEQPKEGTAKPVADDAKKDEVYWKKRLTDARLAVDRARTFAEALQTRINALTADFSARSDPAQRAQIGNDRQKALDELTRVQKEIQDGTKAIADIQEEGRKAGVPAAWLR